MAYVEDYSRFTVFIMGNLLKIRVLERQMVFFGNKILKNRQEIFEFHLNVWLGFELLLRLSRVKQKGSGSEVINIYLSGFVN